MDMTRILAARLTGPGAGRLGILVALWRRRLVRETRDKRDYSTGQRRVTVSKLSAREYDTASIAILPVRRGEAAIGAMGAGLREPRLVKVRAGGRGAGWAVGARGVLTARHVIAPFLSRAVD